MKSLFMLMLALSVFSTAAFAKVGEKDSGTEDCTKVIQQTQNILKHNSDASGEPAPESAPAASGSSGTTIAK